MLCGLGPVWRRRIRSCCRVVGKQNGRARYARPRSDAGRPETPSSWDRCRRWRPNRRYRCAGRSLPGPSSGPACPARGGRSGCPHRQERSRAAVAPGRGGRGPGVPNRGGRPSARPPVPAPDAPSRELPGKAVRGLPAAGTSVRRCAPGGRRSRRWPPRAEGRPPKATAPATPVFRPSDAPPPGPARRAPRRPPRSARRTPPAREAPARWWFESHPRTGPAAPLGALPRGRRGSASGAGVGRDSHRGSAGRRPPAPARAPCPPRRPSPGRRPARRRRPGPRRTARSSSRAAASP